MSFGQYPSQLSPVTKIIKFTLCVKRLEHFGLMTHRKLRQMMEGNRGLLYNKWPKRVCKNRCRTSKIIKYIRETYIGGDYTLWLYYFYEM